MPNNDAIRVASLRDVVEGGPFCATASGTKLALFNIGGKVYAVDNVCPHAGGPLCEGKADGTTVTCPWHGSRFDVSTGAVVKGPANVAVKTYPVEVKGDDVYVTLAEVVPVGVPKPITFAFMPVLDAAHPFSHEPFVTELLASVAFPFKLYGTIPEVPIFQSPDEMDLHLGEIHVTEMDLKKLSGVMTDMNAKWKTEITYCLFHSTQFPGAMLLNIRVPDAPKNEDNSIRY
jgi:nitrite reductase/ring-hydroxylating ferredoxin subunit